MTGKLRKQFNTFSDLRISPAVLALHFDLDQLDEAGNKTFGIGETFMVGPSRERKNVPSTDWLGALRLQRHGQVLQRHVVGTVQRSRELVPRISRDGTKRRRWRECGAKHRRRRFPSPSGKLGPGVYESPCVTCSENGYAGQVRVETVDGLKTFKFILQVAVDPSGIVNEGYPNNGENQEWVCKKSSVRPYGLLVKEL